MTTSRTREQLQRANQMQHRDMQRMAEELREAKAELVRKTEELGAALSILERCEFVPAQVGPQFVHECPYCQGVRSDCGGSGHIDGECALSTFLRWHEHEMLDAEESERWLNCLDSQCQCPCHGPDEDPGPHIDGCAWKLGEATP